MAIGDNPLLSRRALVLAKIESTNNVDASPTATQDALLVSEPSYTVDPNVLERDFVRDDLSPIANRVGRKLSGLSFGVELRSNGVTGTGLLPDEAKLGRLLRACGYSVTAVTGLGTIGAVNEVEGAVSGPTVAFTPGGVNSTQDLYRYALTCILGGASNTAKIRVSDSSGVDPSVVKAETFEATTNSAAGTLTMDAADPLAPVITVAGTWVAGDTIRVNIAGFIDSATISGTTIGEVMDDLNDLIGNLHADISASDDSVSDVTVAFANLMAGVVVESGSTQVALGASGATEVMTWTGSLVKDQAWDVIVTPVGIKYLPVSKNFESITLYAYFDGVLHKLTGCFGTFSINAEAGAYGTLNFEFTGQYIAPVDAEVPDNAIYETTQPPIVELAQLRMGSVPLIVNAFTYTQNNDIVPRSDVNSSDGYRGVRVTGRSPEGGIDPEATLVEDYDFWDDLATSKQVGFQMRVGQDAGETIWVYAPKVNYTGLTGSDRDGIRVYDAGLKFAREYGNDEILVMFC